MAQVSYFYAHQASPVVDCLEEIVPVPLWPFWMNYVVYPVGLSGHNTTTDETAFNRRDR